MNVRNVNEYIKKLKIVLKQKSYDIDGKFSRIIIFSKFIKSKNIYKIPLGELYVNFNEFDNKFKITINDFYIILQENGYVFREIKKELFLFMGAVP